MMMHHSSHPVVVPVATPSRKDVALSHRMGGDDGVPSVSPAIRKGTSSGRASNRVKRVSLPPICPSTSSTAHTGHRRRPSSSAVPIVQTPGDALMDDPQLVYQHQLADHRDYQFYARLVNGIRRTQRYSRKPSLCVQNQQSLSHIIQTRHDDDDGSSSSSLYTAEDYEDTTMVDDDDDCMFHLEM